MGCIQVINEPTTQYDSLLDLCITPSETLISNVCVGDLFSTSDHCIITSQINLPNKSDHTKSTFLNFGLADWDLMRAHLATIDWDYTFVDALSVEEVWLRFKNIINTITYLYVPEMNFSSNKLPWYSYQLKQKRRVKQRKWRKYRNSRAQRHLNEYKNYSSLYKRDVIIAKSKYEKSKFDGKKYEPKKFYNYV